MLGIVSSENAGAGGFTGGLSAAVDWGRTGAVPLANRRGGIGKIGVGSVGIAGSDGRTTGAMPDERADTTDGMRGIGITVLGVGGATRATRTVSMAGLV